VREQAKIILFIAYENNSKIISVKASYNIAMIFVFHKILRKNGI
jgi:hypothetical protein